MIKGFSLIELMITVAILCILCTIAAPIECVTTSERQSSSERNARQWAQSMGYQDVNVSCSGIDSDADGYTSCSVRAGDKIEAVECGYDRPWAPMGQNTSCKIAMPQIRNTY